MIKLRRSLYWFSGALLLTAAATSAIYAYWVDRGAVEPPFRWLRDLLAIASPGIPPHILDFPSKYPVLLVGFIVVISMIRWAMSVLEQGERQTARSRWAGVAPWAAWTPGAIVRPADLLVMGALAALLGSVVLESLWEESPQEHICCEVDATQSLGCTNAHGPCRLAPGEVVRVTMRADEARNHTGVFLEAKAWYTARYISRHGWRDKDISVGPTGFRFCKRAFGLSRFWWMEWLRPHPEGEWFQVLGRIDRAKHPFPLLDSCNATNARPFVAQRAGELVLLVNDLIFSNNSGVMILEIGRPAEGYESTVEARAHDMGRCRPSFERECEYC